MPDRAAFHRDGMRGGGLSIEGVSFERRGTRGALRVLDSVSFALEPTRLLAIVGPSGAGKSTLLSLIAGFESPVSGAIRCNGDEWTARAPSERSIGMSFDDAALHEHLTVAENLDSAAMPRNEPRERRASRVNALADSLGLAALVSRKPATLSAGERRRVAIGRAFIRSPELVLLDEPFANLDRANRFVVRQLVRELQRSTGAMAIVVTHDPTDALAIADDLLVLIAGKVRAHGAARDIAARPNDLEVAQLVDDLGMHVIECTSDGRAAGCAFKPAFMQHAQAAAAGAPLLLGIRPWHLRVGTPAAPSIAIEAKVLAHEPAGLFTDVIAARGDGRTLRARLHAAEAQELPTGEFARFHAHEADVHLFAGPWPGSRIG